MGRHYGELGVESEGVSLSLSLCLFLPLFHSVHLNRKGVSTRVCFNEEGGQRRIKTLEQPSIPLSCACVWVFVCVLQRGETALHMAARAGQSNVVRYLIQNGAQVDARAKV